MAAEEEEEEPQTSMVTGRGRRNATLGTERLLPGFGGGKVLENG